MTISMYKASAPIFVQFLTSLSGVLDKAAAHAEAKKIDPAVLLNTRLYPDMFPLVRLRAALQGAASVAGLLITTEAMVAEVPKKESTPPMPGGGDMGGMGGGMGGMDF